ncbi:MAG: hypothetical protein ACR2HP_04575 [Ilumatobacteraceae bacterium]
MCTTDAHDVVVGSAVVAGAVVEGALDVDPDDDAPTVELDPPRETAGAGDVLEVVRRRAPPTLAGRWRQGADDDA